jgi:6-phosphofructokinase 1
MKKLLLVAGGGDCPKLNAVIRAVVKAADKSNGKHLGSMEAFNTALNTGFFIVKPPARWLEYPFTGQYYF